MLIRNESSAETISDVIIIAVKPPESPRNGIMMTKPYSRKDKNKNNNPSFLFGLPGALLNPAWLIFSVLVSIF